MQELSLNTHTHLHTPRLYRRYDGHLCTTCLRHFSSHSHLMTRAVFDSPQHGAAVFAGPRPSVLHLANTAAPALLCLSYILLKFDRASVCSLRQADLLPHWECAQTHTHTHTQQLVHVSDDSTGQLVSSDRDTVVTGVLSHTDSNMISDTGHDYHTVCLLVCHTN